MGIGRSLAATALAATVLFGCGGGGSSNPLTDDEQHRIDEDLTKLYCADYGPVDTSERERAAEDLAEIYRDKPDATFQSATEKDAQPLADIVRERQLDLENCPTSDLEALDASGDLNRARVEVAHEHNGD